MKRFKYVLLGFIVISIYACSNDDIAVINTRFGDITIELLDSTPLHKENFVKLVREGYYDSLTFHRIESGFVIQGGDPISKDAPGNDPKLGTGGPGYTIDAEIGAKHTYGAVGAARDNNPVKASNGSQFYITTGIKFMEDQLHLIEETKNIKYTPEEIQLYTEKGGAPSLDNAYTVFGYVIDGMDVVEKIQRERMQNPAMERVYMKIKMK